MGGNNQSFIVVSFVNKKKPTLLGELKLPIFVSKLYQYNKNVMIGIGSV